MCRCTKLFLEVSYLIPRLTYKILSSHHLKRPSLDKIAKYPHPHKYSYISNDGNHYMNIKPRKTIEKKLEVPNFHKTLYPLGKPKKSCN